MENFNGGDISNMEKQFRTNLINSISGFKALHLLGTISPDHLPNLAIVSSVFHLGAHPPLMGMVLRPQRPNNDSLKNIKASNQFTLNNVLSSWYKNAHQTSASYPSGHSEFAACGFKELYVGQFKAPFVEESTVKIGLELQEIIPVKLNNTTIIIGKVSLISCADSIIEQDGMLNHQAAGTITAAGLDAYFKPEPLSRLSYAKPESFPVDWPAKEKP